MTYQLDQPIGSIDLTNTEADIVADALRHYLTEVMVPMETTGDPEQREGYVEDSHRMEGVIARVEMLIEGF